MAWKSILPREPVDSSGAAELRLCTHALKYVIAIRMLQTELGLGVAPTEPTTFYTDALAVVNGTALERLTRTSRWQAARYAMMRWGIETRSITLTKKDGILMVADILTKPLVGARFATLRAAIMGLPPPPVETLGGAADESAVPPDAAAPTHAHASAPSTAPRSPPTTRRVGAAQATPPHAPLPRPGKGV